MNSPVLTEIPLCLIASALLFRAAQCDAQVREFPWRENFDTASPPALPSGWQSSRARNAAADDMTLSQSAPRSLPCCVSATNATVAQWLATPLCDFGAVIPSRLTFWVRRSSTFAASLVLDFSPDGGTAWSPLPGDTLRSDGATSYVQASCDIPRDLAGRNGVRFRIRIIPAATGSAGTLRLDDFAMTVHPPYNLSLSRVSASPLRPRAGDPVDVTATVTNTGMLPASGFSVGLFTNCGDSLSPVPCGSLASAYPPGALLPLDSVSVILRLDAPAEGINSLIAAVRDTLDGDPSDDMLPVGFDVTPSSGSLVINEIMYAPLPGESEYVEFMASGPRAVNPNAWRLIVKGTGGVKDRTQVFSPCGAPVSPGGFVVLAEDSSIYRFFPALLDPGSAPVIIPSSWEARLNNDGATLLLVDPWGSVSDSVAYSPSWHNPSVSDKSGRSLERILAPGRSNDPANWSTCTLVEGGTPGRRNSVALARSAAPGGVTASPNPFSPDGDGHDDASVISYSIPSGVWSVSVRIFDARGRLVRTLATCAPSTGRGECIWDGRDDARLTARMGIYVIYIEATAAGGGSFTARGVVVLARRLR